MKRSPSQPSRSACSAPGFTLVELLVALLLASALGLALLSFGNMSTRLLASNLATNHAHVEARLTGQRLFAALGDSGSAFTLLKADLTELDSTKSLDLDPLTGKRISAERAAGVRFWRPLAGAGPIPCRLKSNVQIADTSLTFDAAGIEEVNVGDTLNMPLISRSVRIVGANGPKGNRTVTLNEPLRFVFRNSAVNFTVGYFYRKAAFVVVNKELRYHPSFSGATRDDHTVIRSGITSAAPFSLLYPVAENRTDASQLRVSLETHDLKYDARRFASATTTYRTVVAPLTQPLRITDR